MEKTVSLSPKGFSDYQLIDSGKGKKLERFGDVILIRPEAKAIWKRALPLSDWEKANAEFVETDNRSGKWKLNDLKEKRWQLSYGGLKFFCEIANSKQVGVFPENAVHWDWISKTIETQNSKPNILNLFGYTGIASVAAAKSGASVTHIDSSRRAIGLGKDNQILSGLESANIRWICEDALSFVRREIKRGNNYDGLILDPPMFGMGPKRERWEFFKDYHTLCRMLGKIISDNPAFMVITAYAKDMDFGFLQEGVRLMNLPYGDEAYGELVLQEKSAGRRMGMSYFGQWSSKK